MTVNRHDQQRPAGYEFWVRGHLGATVLRAFPALHAQTRGKDTVLAGAIVDQSGLHGVLAQIEALGLELLGLSRLPAQAKTDRSAQAKDAGPPRRACELPPWRNPRKRPPQWSPPVRPDRFCGRAPVTMAASTCGRSGYAHTWLNANT